jgi:predicted N-formylglutamate amidohydrolase
MVEEIKLLASGEPHPVTVTHEDAPSPFFIAGDHAGRQIPGRLGRLGLHDGELERHIAWDIGIAGTSSFLADRLDATFVSQIYSRLVIDCNRDPKVSSSILEISEATTVPGNRNVTDAERRARQKEIFWPYHDRITELLDRRKRKATPTVLVAMHSFTPVFKGVARPWDVGVLYNRDTTLAHIVLDLLRREGDLEVGDNEPYRVSDATDYTIPVHGERRHLPHVELEIRQDLIATESGQRDWADRLTRLLPEAYKRYSAERR